MSHTYYTRSVEAVGKQVCISYCAFGNDQPRYPYA